MKQILQNLRDGRTHLEEVPAPATPKRGVRIDTRCSLISSGTERMLVEFGRAGWMEKIRQQPAKVRQVLDKVKTNGVLPTLEAVRSKLDQPIPLGYCNVGIVGAVGSEVRDLSVGERVVSNGPHAEVVAVSRNLCARIPDCVSDEEAAFTVLGAIGLQGVRLAAPTIGECFVVIGLGLVGLITVQILRANGCRVLGIDLDPARTALARQFGATTVELSREEDPVVAADTFSRGRGVDGVLIAASTTSNEPVKLAAQISRKRGRIVLVGVSGLELDRADFYEKEISFQVSCSYGPGRYDPVYEDQGNDYPLGFVRWTEQRNFEAVLDLISTRALDVRPLISHRFELAQATSAYDLLVTPGASSLGIVLNFAEGRAGTSSRSVNVATDRSPSQSSEPSVAFVGAGNYGSRVLLPAFMQAGARVTTIVSAGGVSAAHLARKHRIGQATTDARTAIENPTNNVIVVATRHDTHAQLILQALEAGKHVFVEKPLAITLADVERIEASEKAQAPGRRTILMVGFNRRFAPHIQRMKQLLDRVAGPKSYVVTVNAGAIPAEHWTQDPEVGGGRIVGEGCHFIDLLRFFAGCAIESWNVAKMRTQNGGGVSDDKATITLNFADGSLGTLHYFANGHGSFPKERVEVFCAGRILQLDNFRRLRGYGWSGFSQQNLWRQDKGQTNCVRAFLDAVRGRAPAPIAFDEIVEVSRTTIEIAEAIRSQ